MASVKFYPSSKANSDGLYQLLLYFSYSGKRIVIGTPKLITSKECDLLSNKKAIPKALSSKLRDWESDVIRAHEKSIQLMEDLSAEAIKQRIKDIIYPELKAQREREELADKASLNKSFYAFIKDKIEYSNHSKETLKHYKTSFRYLEEFDRVINLGRKTDFEHINNSWYDKFTHFLYHHKLESRIINKNGKLRNTTINKGKKTKNTVGSILKIIKMWIKSAYEDGLHKNEFFRRKEFKVPKERSDSYYLNEDQLERLFNHDLKGNLRLEQVRDRFLLGAYTGLRYSDLMTLNKTHINNGFITIVTAKTKKKVVIPIFNITQYILNKYKYELPKPISNQKFNKYIKELFEEAGFNDEVEKVTTIAGKPERQIFKEYELISSHTMRRSFVSNMLRRGKSITDIMSSTGHSSLSAFQGYDRVNAEDKAIELKKDDRPLPTVLKKVV